MKAFEIEIHWFLTKIGSLLLFSCTIKIALSYIGFVKGTLFLYVFHPVQELYSWKHTLEIEQGSSCKENLLALDLWFVLMSCALGLVMLLNVLCKNKKYWVTCITVLPWTVKAEATDELSHDLLIYRSILQDQGRLLRRSSSVFQVVCCPMAWWLAVP